jgi:uncharacterized protein (DUF427 family)
VSDHPEPITKARHVEPVPRRLRGTLGGETVFDTTHALYFWEFPPFPQFYVPLADVREGALVAEGPAHASPFGTVAVHGLHAGGVERAHAARVFTESEVPGIAGTVRFEWSALDAWFEEDEEVFVHPRNPYVRVDALRSLRALRVELDGTVLGDAPSCVMVFETGLPTRYYLERTTIDFTALVASDTVTRCPYKGTTSGYWSRAGGDASGRDIAWAYDFPTRELGPIAGLVAFYNEKVDLFLDGRALERPQTRMSPPHPARA